jgi:hypothetical protein
MNRAMVSRIVSLVPERMARLRSGTLFMPRQNQGAQVACLAPLLHWLTPLNVTGEEEQRMLGVLALHGKAAKRDDEDEADDEREDVSLPT